MGENSQSDRGSKYSEQTFVGALEEYTKRIESSVAEIENGSERALSRLFALLIFLMLAAGVVPVVSRLTEEFPAGQAYRVFLQGTTAASVLAIMLLTFFTIYTGLLRLRRHRRNLETLLWPYQKLLQKLSQIVDHGDLDEGTSTLIQLKILEAEVAYGRARRVVDGQSPFSWLLAPLMRRRFEPWETRQLADEFKIPIDEAQRIIRRHEPDRQRIRNAAAESSRLYS
jgi:hypothetical protein